MGKQSQPTWADTGADTKGKLSPDSKASRGSGGQCGRKKQAHLCPVGKSGRWVGLWEPFHHQEPGPGKVGTRLDLLGRDPEGFINQQPSMTSSSPTPDQSIQLLPRRVQILKISLKT